MRQVISFTNLFPCELRPQHGVFVYERMRQVLAGLGWDWQVVCPVAKVPWLLCRDQDRQLRRLPRETEFAGVPVHHVWYRHLPGLSLRGQARRMARATLPVLRRLAAGRRTLIDAHYAYPDGVAAGLCAAQLDLPFVVTARGSDVHHLAALPPVRAQFGIFAQAAARLAVSADLAQAFEGLLDAPVEVVRNGVDLEAYQPGDQAAARAALGLTPDRPLVLGVGRLVPGKGFAELCAAVQQLRQSSPALAETQVLLVGDGPQRGELAAGAPPGMLQLLGNQPQAKVCLAMQAADLLALPSHSEGWPNVVTEALACGLPVVGTAVGGMPEILSGAPGCRLVPVGDAAALSQALASCLGGGRDPVQLRAFATRYSWEPSIRRLVDLFTELLP